MRWRSRWLALLTMVLHGAALVGLPLLHERSHREGSARPHVHLGTETLWGAGELLPSTPETAHGAEAQPSTEALHVSHDADLEALELLDVGHAGVAVVDCELARYTLADCPSPDAAPHGFGDELLARAPHRHEAPRDRGAPWDPGHGAHSLEHGGLAVTQTPLFVLPPPRRACVRVEPASPRLPLASRPCLALRARAPPRAA